MHYSPLYRWKEKLEKARQEESKLPQQIRQQIITAFMTSVLTALLVGVPTALLSFYLASLGEEKKAATADERLFLEQRMKVFISTGEHFEAYRLNWSRVIEFGKYEWEGLKKEQPLTAEGKETRKKYWSDRDKAKDSLYADLRAVRLFFSDEVAKRVDDFQKFDSEQSKKTIDKLPPIEDWGKHQEAILEAMRKEVRRK